jgi:hypothetical protein
MQILELTGVSAISENSHTTVVRSEPRIPKVLAPRAAMSFYCVDGWYLGPNGKDITYDALRIKAGSVTSVPTGTSFSTPAVISVILNLPPVK